MPSGADDRPSSASAVRLLMALTFATGVADAVGYLGLDHVFTGNMTGNVVILGMALTGHTGLPVLGPALALVGFGVGAAVAGRRLARTGTGWTRTVSLLLVATGLLELAVGIALSAGLDHTRTSVEVTATSVLAFAMGLQAAAARHVAVKDVTTVVVTSTITGFAADSWLGGGGAGAATTRRRGLAVVAIGAGATAGAALVHWSPGAGTLLAAGVTLAVAGRALATRRRRRD